MVELSDETLMAFADGALDPHEGARISEIIANRPDLQQRVAVFEATGRVLAGPYEATSRLPVPRQFVDLVLGHRFAPAMPKRGAVPSGIWGKPLRLRGIDLTGWRGALAASVCLLAGAGIGWHLGQSSPSQSDNAALIAFVNGRLVAAGDLGRALESMPSAVRIAPRRGEKPSSQADVRIRMSFRSRDGFCRQYEIWRVDVQTSPGIACRGDDGRWHLRIHVAGNVRAAADGKTTSAAGDSVDIAPVASRMMEGDALGAAEEASAIANGWRR